MPNDSNISKPAVDACGYAIYEAENKIYFVNYGTNGYYTIQFLALLFAVLFIFNSRILIFENIFLGILMISAGLVLLGSIYGIRILMRKAKEKPLQDLSVIMIADLGDKTVKDKNGNKLADLDQLRFGQTRQIFSSASILRAYWPGGYVSVIVGSPFAFGFEKFKSYLKDRGLMKR